MDMTREQYHELVLRVEAYARRHPVRYKVRLGLLALFGYAYIWLMLGVIAAVLALLVLLAETVHGGAVMVVVKLGWPLLVLGYAIVRALWVRFPRPDGIEIVRRDAPDLFALVDDLRRRLACPRFHHVLLTDEWNASVGQRPRLGPFGWYENYLELGVPLMSGLPSDEFHAVLAHEFGHLSRSHGRFGSWIYRIRATWSELLESLSLIRHRWRGLFEAFLRRFAPYFNAYSFVLVRAREREADRVAAELTGHETLARALVTLSLGGAFLGRRYWPSVEHLAHEHAEPPEGIISQMIHALRGGAPAPDARSWLEEALRRKTGIEDTHPCLADRLTALGVTPQRAAAGERAAVPSAAEQFLGDTLRVALTGLDRTWRDRAARAWQERHAAAGRGRARLDDIAARAAAGPLPPELAWERIRLTMDLRGEEATEPLLREALAVNAEHVGAGFMLGRLLLQRGDAAGVEYLERAMQRDPGCVPAACAAAAGFHELAGRDGDAAAYRTRARVGADLLDHAEAERQRVDAEDEFLPHELPAEEIERLRREIAGFFDVQRAWLVRKAVRHLPQKPFYVLGVALGRWYHWRTQRDNQEVVHGLATKVAYPGRVWIIHLNRHRAKVARKMKRATGSEILRR